MHTRPHVPEQWRASVYLGTAATEKRVEWLDECAIYSPLNDTVRVFNYNPMDDILVRFAPTNVQHMHNISSSFSIQRK